MRTPEQIAMQVLGEDGAIDPEVVDAIRLAVQEAVKEFSALCKQNRVDYEIAGTLYRQDMETLARAHFKKAGY